MKSIKSIDDMQTEISSASNTMIVKSFQQCGVCSFDLGASILIHYVYLCSYIHCIYVWRKQRTVICGFKFEKI